MISSSSSLPIKQHVVAILGWGLGLYSGSQFHGDL